MWKCPQCQAEMDDERSICLQCGTNKGKEEGKTPPFVLPPDDQNNPENNDPNPKPEQEAENMAKKTRQSASDLILDRAKTSNGDKPLDTFEVRFSGKAFRARCIFIWIVTLVCVGLGFYLMKNGVLGEYMGTYMKFAWALFLGVPALLWAWFAGIYWYNTTMIVYRLTEHNLYNEHGFLHRVTDTLEVISIDDLRMTQTLWDRLINGGVGTIQVFSKSDKTDSVLLLRGLEDPKRILEAIEDARRRRRSLRGVMQL